MKRSLNGHTTLTLIFLGIALLPYEGIGEDVRQNGKNILYYGWFFDEQTAYSLKEITESFLNDSLRGIPEFREFMDTAKFNSNIADAFEYYKKPTDPNTGEWDPFYHVTAKYCGGIDDCSPYSGQVANVTDKTFTMELIGLFFTNRTYGIRVRLSEEQENLFENDAKSSIKMDKRAKNSESTKKARQSYYGIVFEPQELDLNPSMSKAHITIGCAPGVAAVTTGPDLLGIVGMEVNTDVPKKNHSLEKAHVVQYGEWEAFVLYPYNKMLVNATFSPYFSGADALRITQTLIAPLTLIGILTTLYPAFNL